MMYPPDIVLMAAVLTAAMVVALTIYACTTNTDFTVCSGLLFMLFIGLVVASILSYFMQSRILQIAISYFGAILFGIYLIYDTQLILGKQSNSLSIDDYVMASVMLYVDIVQLFIYILQILGESN